MELSVLFGMKLKKQTHFSEDLVQIKKYDGIVQRFTSSLKTTHLLICCQDIGISCSIRPSSRGFYFTCFSSLGEIKVKLSVMFSVNGTAADAFTKAPI